MTDKVIESSQMTFSGRGSFSTAVLDVLTLTSSSLMDGVLLSVAGNRDFFSMLLGARLGPDDDADTSLSSLEEGEVFEIFRCDPLEAGRTGTSSPSLLAVALL